MPEYASQSDANGWPSLYPMCSPYRTLMLDTGDGHVLYVEECGNPKGKPVVVLHGGPGGGCSPTMRRFFDPKHYRVILFDQRGCGRSLPHASVVNNTTPHLVADIERIRELLEIDEWMVFGGSWGATLALVYAQAHPDRVNYLVLRGVFTMTKAELHWFYGGGAGRFFPEPWSRFAGAIPETEREDLIAAYHKRLFSGNRREEIRFAKVWTGYENAMAVLNSNGAAGVASDNYAHAFARIENHYFLNLGFLGSDGEIRDRMSRIHHIPATIVQGRYDVICPPHTAVALAEDWGQADLRLVIGGHAMTDPQITAALLRATNDARVNSC